VDRIRGESARNLRENTVTASASVNEVIGSVSLNGTASVLGTTTEKADIRGTSSVVTRNTTHRTVAHRETTTEIETATERKARNMQKRVTRKRSSTDLRNIIASLNETIGGGTERVCTAEIRSGMTPVAEGRGQKVFLLTRKKARQRRSSRTRTKSRRDGLKRFVCGHTCNKKVKDLI